MAKGMFLSMCGQALVARRNVGIVRVMLFAMLACVASSSALSANRIVGGDEVEVESDYPWMVSLRNSATGEHECGGTLIHERWVMSASRCFYEEPAEAISVYVGDYDISRIEETERRIGVISRVESGRDLMLLELADAVDVSVYPPLELVSSAMFEGVEAGHLLTIVGWGDRDGNPNLISSGGGEDTINEDFPSVLHEVNVPLFNQTECNKAFLNGDLETSLGADFLPIYGNAIDGKHICAGYIEETDDGLQGLCEKDSGGPLLFQTGGEWFQAGVASIAPSVCGSLDYPDVFTRVSAFKEWVDNIINPVDLTPDKLSLPENVTSSILEDGENPVCSGGSDESLKYRIKEVNGFSLSFTNSAADSFVIDSVELQVDEIETNECGVGTVKYTPSELSITSTEDSALPDCQGSELAPGESCEVHIRMNFLSPGIKFATLMIGVEGKEESYSFELSGNVIGEADFSSSVGEGVFFFIEKQNEWDLQGDIVSELVSDYTLYEQTMLIGKVDGSGQLSFDWKVDDTSVMDVSLWINGEELSEYKPAEAYGRETIVLPEDQVNTVEWRMARGELWRSTSESSLGDEGKTLYLKSVNFTADNPDVVEDTSPSNSKSSGGAFHPLALVFLAVLFFFRRNAAGISKTYRAMSVVIVMLVVSSGWARAENRIIGGVDAEFRDYPWMVSLQNKYTGEHFCGATLVDEYYVLTASHCYAGEALDSLVAVIGAYDLSNSSGYDLPEQSNARAVNLIEYNEAENGDYLLFQLAETVSDVPVLSLATEADMRKIAEGDSLRVIGWGDIDPDDSVATYPDVLQEADVTLMNHETCQDNYAEIGDEVTDDMICAGVLAGGLDSCQGDSGGPLLWQNENRDWVQVGVTSFGEGCGQAQYPGVYTRVASYLDDFEGVKEWSDVVLNAQYLGEMTVGSPYEYTLNLTSNLVQPFEISWMQFGSGDVSGFQVVGDRCSNDVLYLGDNCELDLKLDFDQDGEKTAVMTAIYTNEGFNWYRLSTRVYPENDMEIAGSGIDFILESASTWRNVGDSELAVEMPDTQDISRFSSRFSRAGTLAFDWLLSSSDVMNLDVYIDGVRQTTEVVDGVEQDLVVGSSYSNVVIELPEGGAYVEWVLARKRGASLGLGEGDDARIASISFTAIEAEQEESDSNKKSDSSGGAIAWQLICLCLLLLTYRRRFLKLAP